MDARWSPELVFRKVEDLRVAEVCNPALSEVEDPAHVIGFRLSRPLDMAINREAVSLIEPAYRLREAHLPDTRTPGPCAWIMGRVAKASLKINPPCEMPRDPANVTPAGISMTNSSVKIRSVRSSSDSPSTKTT